VFKKKTTQVFNGFRTFVLQELAEEEPGRSFQWRQMEAPQLHSTFAEWYLRKRSFFRFRQLCR
jgi:hypothetical protein